MLNRFESYNFTLPLEKSKFHADRLLIINKIINHENL